MSAPGDEDTQVEAGSGRDGDAGDREETETKILPPDQNGPIGAPAHVRRLYVKTSPAEEEDARGSAPTPARAERPSVTPTVARSHGGDSSHGTSGPTPLQTMRVGEIERTRVFVRIAMVMAMAVSVAAPFLGGDPRARAVVFAGMGLIFGACAWLAWSMREDSGYTAARALVASWACVVGALSGIYFFGVFSPAAVVVPFGIYFFSLSQSSGAALAAYLAAGGSYALLAIAELSGLILDRGLVRSAGQPALDRAVMLLLVEATFASTFVLSRATRRANLLALEQHDRVLRSLGHREALLKEARQDLARALEAGGVGRFTDEVLGSFRLGIVLGRGAMGDVYEAVHTGTGEPAAVKLLQSHLYQEPENVRRFLREAKLAQAMRVRNVVHVLEIGGVDAPVPYIAMERLRGEDLSDHLRRHRRLSIRRTLKLVREVGRGLEAARAAGIVHRDLKPRNLFLAETKEGRSIWKILDFGVSKLAGAQGTLTQDRVIGTPAYMAPEQARGLDVTYLTDLYALGVLCYRVLTGRPAFAGKDVPETLYSVVHRMPPAPRSVVPTLPAEIDRVLAIAMAKDPADRFDSARELERALDEASAGDIDPRLRARAEEVIQKHPWG